MIEIPDLMLYFHIPFCLKKCGYCDFYSVNSLETNKSVIDDFVNTLLNEMSQRFSQYNTFLNKYQIPKRVKSIFFGGGTPTLLSISHFEKIFVAINAFLVDNTITGIEITSEANPDTVDYQYLSSLKNFGVNRISIGAQSFDNKVLQILQRNHNPQNVVNSILYAKELKMRTSLDLIYGTPTETLESWQNTVESAVRLEPDHISAYALTLEPNVELSHIIKRGKLSDIDQDLQAQMYEIADSKLLESGYIWYEISNWGKVDANNNVDKSIHNLGYWTGCDYIGFGPSAHSYSHTVDYPKVIRSANSRNVIRWQTEFSEVINLDEQTEEKLMLDIRLNKPIELKRFEANKISQAIDSGYIDQTTFIPTLKGRLLNDSLFSLLDSGLKANSQKVICSKFLTTRCNSCPQCIME